MLHRKTGLRAIAALIGLLCLTPAWAADYTLDVQLDPAAKTVTGSVELEWTNSTSTAAGDLRFHLYFNAWRDEKASFFDSPRWRSRDLSEWREGEWGATDVESFRLIRSTPEGDSDQDLTQQMQFIQPDDGNPDDRTVMRVPLHPPAAPGETLRAVMTFRTKIPRTFTRTGYRGDYLLLAHWFPKLGVFQENGLWNCHQFIQTEFFSDFGDYDVTVRLPSDWVFGATGLPVDEKDLDGGLTQHRYRQKRVHAFTWVASPHFLEYERTFSHPVLQDVKMRLLLMPDHRGQEDRYFAATEAALRYYGEWFGEYPYPHITVVDPAYRSGTGGMEYPTLFTGGTRWLQPQGTGSPEGVTVHEAGHQFWYGIVANNEFEDAWLDEGFNTYSTRRGMLTAFPDQFITRRYLKEFVPVVYRDLPVAQRSVAALGGIDSDLQKDRMSRPSWRQGPDAYGVNSYTKPAIMLLTLERFLGWEPFQRIMSTYFERWKFRHPKPQDFFEIADEVSGRNLNFFWAQTYNDSILFDYSVDWVGETRNESPAVIVRRREEGVFPVEVKVTFEDGETVLKNWDGRERWKQFVFPRERCIVQVEVDPEEKLALDVHRTNNSWAREAPVQLASAKWSFQWMLWLQTLMEQCAFYM